MKYLVNRVDLGKRTVGYEIYDSENKEIIGMTEKQIKDSMGSGGRIQGFTLDTEGNLQLDKDGFHTSNIMIKTGINTFTPMTTSNTAASVFYVLIAIHKAKDTTTYEVVNSRFGRTLITEGRLKAYLELCCLIGGCYLDSKGKVIICDGVDAFEEEQ